MSIEPYSSPKIPAQLQGLPGVVKADLDGGGAGRVQAVDDARQVVRIAAVVPAAEPLHIIVADGGAAAPRQAQYLLRAQTSYIMC